MKQIILNKQNILDFIDWIQKESWEPDIFFEKLHQWFSGETLDFSLPPILLSSGYLLTEQTAKENKISDTARKHWNQLILTTTAWNESYKVSNRNTIFHSLSEIKKALDVVTPEFKYSLQSNFTPYKEAFTGREDILAEIHEKLWTQHNALFLYGIAGIGKSVLAKMYATRYAPFYETIIFGTYETNIIELFTNDNIFPIHGLSLPESGKRGEKGRYFRKKLKILETLVTPHTLLIIDNFDVTKDPHLSDILSLPCKIIFTTRTSPQMFGTQGISIGALPDKMQLRQLFFLYAPHLNYTECELVSLDNLIESIQGHTLTIKLVAAHLKQTKLSPKELSLNSSDIMNQISELFRIANFTKDERTVLRYLSIMPLSGITLKSFSEYCHFTKMSIVNNLIHRNMIEYTPSSEVISLHPLIAQTVRNLEQPNFSNCWPYASTICTFGRQTWWNTSQEMDKYRKYFYTFMEYIDTPEKRRMDDIIYLVDGCWQLGNFTLAEKYGKMLHTFCLEHFGSEHLMTARIRHSIGTIYYNWGKIEKASQWYILGYQDYRNVQNPDVYFYSILLMKAGRTKRYEKKWEESEDYLQKAIAFLQKYLDINSELPTDKPPKVDWLILLFDIYSEYILLFQDQKKYQESWNWCMKYKQQYDAISFQHESMLWKLYYPMGLAKTGLGELSEAEQYLDTALAYAEKYHQKHVVINLMILDALEEIIRNPDKKKEIRTKIRKLRKKS